ncbi:MAG: lipocalin-like domain-containing protein [Robiginitalea sp.]
MKNTFLAMLALALVSACAEKKEAPAEVAVTIEEPSIEGAWVLDHISWKSPDTTMYWKPFKSILIYTDQYYSVEVARDERPSWPSLGEGEERSPEDIIKAFNGLISNSGTYEAVGDSLIHHVIVAKSPYLMNDSPRYARHLTIEKDSAYFTNTNEEGVQIWVMKRME